MKVRFATAAAPGRVNEDLVVTAGGLVAVFDGVTQPVDAGSGCVHDPAWFVGRLGRRLLWRYTSAPCSSLAELLAEAIDAVRGDHGGGCDLANPRTPAATVCALKVDGGRAEYLVLCDSPLVLRRDTGVEVVADGRFDALLARLRERRGKGFRAALPEKYGYVNRPGGYWIAAAEPRAAFEAVRGEAAIGELRRAVLLTDGASCAVDGYRLTDWAGLAELAGEGGPAELIRVVRAAERADPDGAAHWRYKRHDDATVAVCAFD